jgi:hypothetical protein
MWIGCLLFVPKRAIEMLKQVQRFLDKFTPGGTIKQVNLSKCEFKKT